MRIDRTLLLAGLLAGSAQAQSQAPMSAIDWLSDSLNTPDITAALPPEPAATGRAATEVITVTPLDDPSSDAVGLLPVSVTGLPRTLWGATRSQELARMLTRLDTNLVPALRELLYTLLLAELDPPADTDPSALLFLARIDTLLRLGAVDQAQALLERAGTARPELFRRWFDASLLTGTEDAACARLRGNPDLSPTLPARIFCLARSGDWDAAAVTLDTGRALGDLDVAQEALLNRFLDLEGFDEAPPLRAPTRPSPLEFRLYEAIGEALPTSSLPLAYAHTDLGPNNGWKAQIVAAERLARSGALDDNKLLGLYTERRPAASGGVWDRVQAVQRLDAAVTAGDVEAVAAALPAAWRAMRSQSLETLFARLYGERLAALPLTGATKDMAFRIGLLSDDYESAASAHEPQTAEERFLVGLAKGMLAGIAAPDDLAQAIADGFLADAPPDALSRMVENDELGAAILRAMDMASEAAHGDLDQLADALALFRAVGLEDVARRMGLQLMLLESRG